MYPYLNVFDRQIPTYGICLLLGIAVVFILSMKTAKEYNYSYYDLLLVGGFAILFALPAGSLLYVMVTYNLEEIVQHIAEGNFKVFGGLVFYGALIGGILGGLLGVYLARMDLLTTERIIIPYIPIGQAVGRIGCLLAGCCYGIEYAGPFAVYYQSSIAGALPQQGYFPVQILEALLNVCIYLILIRISRRTKYKFELLSVYLILYGIIRFLLELLRGDVIRGFYFNISTSQWISIAMCVLGSSYLITVKIAKKRMQKPTK